jgi:hypothetical protein
VPSQWKNKTMLVIISQSLIGLYRKNNIVGNLNMQLKLLKGNFIYDFFAMLDGFFE